MTDRKPRDAKSFNNPLGREGRHFREDCSRRGHELYGPVREWMEDHGCPPQLTGDREEQRHAIDYASSNAYHLLARIVWSRDDAEAFEQNWTVALESPEFHDHMRPHFAKMEAFFDAMHRSEAVTTRLP